MSRGERQKPVTQKYRDNYDSIFSPLPIPMSKSQAKRLTAQNCTVVDEICGTSVYINGKLQPKKEGMSYVVRDFCAWCGAGKGAARRAGEGTCERCTTERDRVVGEGGKCPFTVGTSGDKG